MTAPAPGDLPPPDIMDRAGRLRRLAIALVVGAVLGAIAWGITYNMVRPDHATADWSPTHVRNGYRFIYYCTGGAFAAGFGLTLAILSHRAKTAWRRQRDVPEARVNRS